MIWFTSDQHFGHANIIKYCTRPFKDADEMDVEIMRRHNAVVDAYDTVYHLGDFSMHPRHLEKLKLLKGIHRLVMGNHDHCHPVHKNTIEKRARLQSLYFESGFQSVEISRLISMWDNPELTWRRALLHHLPYTGDHHDSEERYRDLRPKDDGLWLLHGHVHTTWKTRGKMINVGVDQWDFTPVPATRIIEIMRGKNA